MVRTPLDFERRFERMQDAASVDPGPEGAATSLSGKERATLEHIASANWFRARDVDERMNCVEMWSRGLLTFATRDDEIGYALSKKGMAALH